MRDGRSLMRLRLDARTQAILRRLPLNPYSLAELALLGVLAVQCARLTWAIATPVAPLGDWRPARPAVPDDPAGVLAGFDPFFRISGAQPGAAAVTSLAIKLFGIRVDEAMGRGSAIVAGPDGVQKSVSVGEEVAPGVVLTAVAFDHITVTRGGVPEALFLDQSAAATATAATGATAAAPAAPAGISMDQLVAEVGVIPRIERGRVSGLVVRRQGTGAVFGRTGLQDGDVVIELNGRPVTGPEDLQRVSRDYPAGGTVPITVERDGETLSLSIQVAPR